MAFAEKFNNFSFGNTVGKKKKCCFYYSFQAVPQHTRSDAVCHRGVCSLPALPNPCQAGVTVSFLLLPACPRALGFPLPIRI